MVSKSSNSTVEPFKVRPLSRTLWAAYCTAWAEFEARSTAETAMQVERCYAVWLDAWRAESPPASPMVEQRLDEGLPRLRRTLARIVADRRRAA